MSDSSDIRGMEEEIPSSIAWYSLSIEKIIEKFNTDVENGLSSPEASSRLRRYGPNKLREVKGVPTWIILLNQFKSLIVVLLLIATGIALFLGDNIEALAVFMVIILNAAFGFFTEWRAEKSMQSLKNLVVPKARVVRDGDVDEILATDLVPGDIILLEAGDRVPADGRLVEAVDLSLQEAALTGESLSVRKDPEVVVGENTPLGDRVNMVYMSMIVTEGRGKAIVVKTGMKTEVGQISGMIEGAGEEMTPLERRLERLGRYLVILCFGISVIIIIAGILRGLPSIDMLRTGLSLAIAAVPEGLPVVATITLAIGMRRMARRNAIIRRLPAVETLGCTTTICTDKTGTLTENELMVREIYLHPDTIKVTGEGYVPEGTFDLEGKKARKDERLRMALKIAALCNNAALDEEIETGGVSWDVIGDPTEGALLVAAEKIGYQPKELRKEYPRLDELPFDSDKKIMATLHEVRDGENPSSSTHRLLGVKGALEVILDSCDYVYKGTEIILLTDEDREAISVQADEMAKRALRVLTVAYKELPVSQDSVEDNDIQGLTFLGLMGMTDSPRPEAEGAIEECQTAGIKVIMITGDNKITAEVIAKELGLASDDSLILDYSEIDFKDREELKEIVKKVTVYSRVSPADKLNIVDALQENGEIVAMTGDGVNDAPALKTADIGISMGQTGTDVAQEASDMVLADDNFATIVAAVEEGRVIYANIKKFIHYLFSCNLSEILTMFVATMVGWPLPLLPLQILWMNLITDVFPAMALAMEGPEEGIMKQSPRDPNEQILTRGFQFMILRQGIVLTAVTLLSYLWGLNQYGPGHRAITISFMTLSLSQLLFVFNCRSAYSSIFKMGLFSNLYIVGASILTIGLQLLAVYLPVLQLVLKTVPLGLLDWEVILIASLTPLVIGEIYKIGLRIKVPLEERRI